MPLKFHCSNGHGLTVDEQHAGKTVRCPKCNEQLQAPDVATTPADSPKAFTLVKSEQTGVNLAEFSVAADSSVARESRAAQENRAAKEGTRRRRSPESVAEKRGGIGGIAFVLVLVLVLVAAIAAAIWFTSR